MDVYTNEGREMLMKNGRMIKFPTQSEAYEYLKDNKLEMRNVGQGSSYSFIYVSEEELNKIGGN